MILPSVRRPFLPVFLLIPVLTGALFCPTLSRPVFADEFDDALAAEGKAKDDADAVVAAAKTPPEKINAYYHRSYLPDDMDDPDDSDWQSAVDDIDQAIKLIDEMEKDGTVKITEKANIYFRRGYVLSSFSEAGIDYAATVNSYDKAEAAGYEALNAKDDSKGGELWNNRALAKSHLYDYSGALRDFDTAVAHSAESLWIKNRADLKFQMGDYEGALTDWNVAKAKRAMLGEAPYDPEEAPFNKTVAASPKSAAPLIARARFFVKKAMVATVVGRDLKVMVPYYVSFHPIDEPAKPKPHEYTKLELMNFALADLNRAILVEPSSSAAWLERGRTRNLYLGVPEWKSNRPFGTDGPLADFKTAASVDDKNAAAWVEIARCQLTMLKDDDMPTLGETDAQWVAKKRSLIDEAIADLSRAIYLKPNSSGDAHYLRAYGERNKSAIDYHTVVVDYTAAITQKLCAVDDDPAYGPPDPKKLAEAHSVLGQIANLEGRLETAATEYGEELKIDVNDTDPYMNRGKIYIQQGKYDAAIKDFDFVIKTKPQLAEAWLWRGDAHDGKGETELAKADIAQALLLDPKLSEPLAGTRYAVQNPQPKASFAPVPVQGDLPHGLSGTALDHKNAGNELRIKKDMDGALAEYNNALRIDPKFADAYCNRGSVYSDRGETDLALADYARTIELDPKHRIVYLNRGLLWRRLEEPTRERADLDYALQYADNDARRGTIYAERGYTRCVAGDKSGALADAKQGTALSPQDAYNWKTQGRVQLTFTLYPDAVKSFRQAAQLKPDDSESHVNLAIALAHVGDAEAETELEKGMTGATPEALKELTRILDNLIRMNPNEAMMKTLRADVDKAAKA